MIAAISFCAYVANNEVFLYIYTVFFAFFQLIIYFVGKTIGSVLVCHSSLLCLLDPAEYFRYINYKVFDCAVSSTRADGILLVIAIFFFLSCSLCFFSRVDMRYRTIRFIKKSRKHRKSNLFLLELEKIMFGYKVIAIVIVVCALQFVTYVKKENTENMNELIYKGYINQIEGALNEEKIQYINDEVARMENLKIQLNYWEQQFDTNKISSTKYEYESEKISKELVKETALMKCKNYIDYLSSMDDKQLEIVYDTGWNYLFGGANYKYDMRNAIIVVIAIIIGVSFLYVEDYKYNIHPILKLCKNYKKLNIRKGCVMHMYIGFIYVIVYLPEVLWVCYNYGLSHLHADSASIMCLESVKGNLSIVGYFCLVHIIRLTACYIICLITIFIGRRIKNTNVTIMTTAVLFLLPLLLRTIGIEVFDIVTLNSLLSGNYFLQNVL